jgi:hypothetical protein
MSAPNRNPRVERSGTSGASLVNPSVGLLLQAQEYLLDVFQRSILFWDTLRRRGVNAQRRQLQGHPPVLQYEYKMLLDGRKLPRPVNYALLRIEPDRSVPTDARKRPFVIIDPRAGHGPGIGGFKQESEVGMALRAGHPVYFVSFFPRPMPGQKLADVATAEALFIEKVARRHPEADKPCVIGNCQAGWAVAALAAVRPEIMGPLILSGAPLAYWSGASGKNPMRYAGGLLGGQWIESLACDLGHGLFDGAYLVQNFENLNPANTLWTKYYNLYSKIDTEAERFLEFEAWWSGYFLMNAEEMDAIVTDLFIGNKLARGLVTGVGGKTIDLKQIRSPVVVFASRGDNISPPQQALNWIEDVYGSDRALLESGRVIVYLLHENVGHLGIFVSGSVAKKEYAQLVGTLEMIDALPPGLYQMIIQPLAAPHSQETGATQYSVRFEMRKLSDIRGMDGSRRDEQYFVAVDAVSRLGEAIYQAWLGPWLRLVSTDWSAELLRQWHPLRVQRRLLSGQNPLLAAFSSLAPLVRRFRRAASEGNLFRAQEAVASEAIIATLDLYRELRDAGWEALFKLAYGPLGWGALFRSTPSPRLSVSPVPVPPEIIANGELTKGGPLAAILRMLAAACLDAGVFDYRSARALRSLLSYSAFSDVTPTELKALFREQAALLRRHPKLAINALPDMLLDEDTRHDAVRTVWEVLKAGSDAPRLGGPLCRRMRQLLGNGSSIEINSSAALPSGLPACPPSRC